MSCLRSIQRSGRHHPLHAEEVDVVHDFKNIVQCHLPRHFRGQTKPHGFRFRKFQGVTQMYVRLHAEEEWAPKETNCQYPKEHLGPALGFLCLKVSHETCLRLVSKKIHEDWENA